jgi:pilus assembly protein CpaE
MAIRNANTPVPVVQAIIIDEDAKSRRRLCDGVQGYGLASSPGGSTQANGLPVINIQVVAETESLMYGYELIRQNRPNVVFVDLRSNDDSTEWPQKSLELIQRVSTYFKNTIIIASGPADPSMDLLMACMQAGAREYLKRPLQATDITEVLQKIQAALISDTDDGDRTGRIFTVFSNKGGLGKTSVAVNLALALSQETGSKVALVDLNLQLGDITTFLDITPKQTIVDITKNISRVDEAYLESSLARYEYNGAQLYVLADPLHVEDAEEVTSDQINTVLTVLKATFPYVVIDTTTSFDAKTLTALDLADQILLVSMVNLPCIRSSQRVLSLFERLGYDQQKVQLVINRYVDNDEITVEDMEDTLEYPVYWKIPNNYNAVMTSINRGVPIQALPNSATLQHSFSQLARKLSGLVAHGGAVHDGHAGLSSGKLLPLAGNLPSQLLTGALSKLAPGLMSRFGAKTTPSAQSPLPLGEGGNSYP